MTNDERRTDLGKALRALRVASGKTGDAIARRAAMSAAKLSKIENGRVLPSTQDAELILAALDVSDDAKAEFVAAARLAATEETAWREIRRIGQWKHQKAIQAIEARTTTLRLFQGQLIPGLLQPAEYASAVFGLTPALPDDTRAKVIAARLERQAVLYDLERTFHFVICEHVLRWLICAPPIMAVQLDRLLSLSRLPNVRIDVVPLGRQMPDLPMTCFSVHDERLVVIETFHSEISTRDPRDIAMYLATHERFADVALHDDEARRFLRAIRDEHFRGRESV
ncbi:helix-turn-helix domain-containing protein [Kribbella sp. WER1]